MTPTQIFTGPRVARGLQARVLGMIYEDLLGSCLEAAGWEVLAGRRRNIESDVLKPVVYVQGKGMMCDYVLARDGKTYIAEAKAWPVFEGRVRTAEPAYLPRAVPSFLALDPRVDECFIGGRSALGERVQLDGKLLLWWEITADEIEYWRMRNLELLSIRELLETGRSIPEFVSRVETYRRWVHEFFDHLLGL